MPEFQLSDKVRELINKSRIVSFANWQDIYDAQLIEYLQAADDQGRYLTDADLQEMQKLEPAIAKYLSTVQVLRDQVNEIVNEARAEVLQTFPEITQIGGGLYPSVRADACWRDFWHFLRCITYAIAGHRADYLSESGLRHMNLLYQELQVPLDAMVIGLGGIKTACLSRVDSDRRSEIAPYFDCLIEKLQQFV